MQLIRLTPENAIGHINCEIIFKTRGNHAIKRIIKVSDSGKSIQIDCPDLNNSLEIVSRRIYIIA
jgi:hypothetical protein